MRRGKHTLYIKSSGKGKAPQVTRVVSRAINKKVKYQLNKNLEKKFLIRSQATTASTTWSFFRLTDVPQSSTVDQSDSTRIGDRIRVSSLYVNYGLTCADAHNKVRIIIFQYKEQDDGATTLPNATILLQSPSTYPFLSTFNHDHKMSGDFTVLYDRFHLLSNTAEEQSRVYVQKRSIKISKKYLARNIQFVGGGVNGKNHVYMAFISDSSAISHPSVAVYSKLLYTDA